MRDVVFFCSALMLMGIIDFWGKRENGRKKGRFSPAAAQAAVIISQQCQAVVLFLKTGLDIF
jgi:hypothetical protein